MSARKESYTSLEEWVGSFRDDPRAFEISIYYLQQTLLKCGFRVLPPRELLLDHYLRFFRKAVKKWWNVPRDSLTYPLVVRDAVSEATNQFLRDAGLPDSV